jgi:serine/threonine protein kinase
MEFRPKSDPLWKIQRSESDHFPKFMMSFPYWKPSDATPEGEIKDFLVGDNLFKGPFSLVYRAIGIRGDFAGRQLALKFVKHRKGVAEASVIEREIKLLKSLRHPCIVPILDDFRYGSYHCIVFPYAEHGSLEDYLAPSNRPYLNSDQARSVAFQVLRAVSYIHSMGIVHCDIKLANILVHTADSHDLRIWLCDFGLAKSTADAARFEGAVGTDGFRPPESYIGFGFTEVVDEFAVGVVVYRALLGVFPFGSAKCLRARRVDAIMQQQGWTGHLAVAKKCVWRLLDPDEKTRISASEALKDDWMRPLLENEGQTETDCEECTDRITMPVETAHSAVLFAQ